MLSGGRTSTRPQPLDVRPKSPTKDFLDQGAADPKGSSEDCLLGVGGTFSDASHLFFCQLGFLVLRSTRTPFWVKTGRILVPKGTTPFGNHVLHVVYVPAKEQMVRVHTQPIVTDVANKQPLGDWTLS